MHHAEIAVNNNWKGIIVYGSVRDVDALEELDIGIQALLQFLWAPMAIVGEVDIPVNFGGVTFLPGDHIYADNTGIILSPEPLDIDKQIVYRKPAAAFLLAVFAKSH